MVDYNKDDILLIARHLSEQGDYYSPQWEQAADEMNRQRDEIDGLRWALKFYANKENWREYCGNTNINLDFGTIARAALGEGKE